MRIWRMHKGDLQIRPVAPVAMDHQRRTLATAAVAIRAVMPRRSRKALQARSDGDSAAVDAFPEVSFSQL
jgi:hypothetical protein